MNFFPVIRAVHIDGGKFAIFMVQNDLTPNNIVERGKTLLSLQSNELSLEQIFLRLTETDNDEARRQLGATEETAEEASEEISETSAEEKTEINESEGEE